MSGLGPVADYTGTVGHTGTVDHSVCAGVVRGCGVCAVVTIDATFWGEVWRIPVTNNNLKPNASQTQET